MAQILHNHHIHSDSNTATCRLSYGYGLSTADTRLAVHVFLLIYSSVRKKALCSVFDARAAVIHSGYHVTVTCLITDHCCWHVCPCSGSSSISASPPPPSGLTTRNSRTCRLPCTCVDVSCHALTCRFVPPGFRRLREQNDRRD